ncbi:MAG: LysR family transcriptional regulator [Ilumatobacteraceae bacterium]|nr:LysR family transcriptional regulator [Actinomycetota bacterium]
MAEPLDIPLRQLEYLVAVADHPTWSAAAASLGVSASALSQGLADLERRIGVQLFDRQGRRRVLTELANTVLQHARTVQSMSHDLAQWAERVNTLKVGSIRVGMLDVGAILHFPEVLRMFRADFPEIGLHLTVAPSSELLAGLRRADFDVIVCVSPSEIPPAVSMTPLLQEDLVVVRPPNVKSRIPSAWGPWVLFPEGSHTRSLIERSLREHGARTHVVAESHQPDVLAQMVSLGLGWGVLPLAQVPENLDIEIGEPIVTRDLVICQRDGAPQHPGVSVLIQRLQSAAQPA